MANPPKMPPRTVPELIRDIGVLVLFTAAMFVTLLLAVEFKISSYPRIHIEAASFVSHGRPSPVSFYGNVSFAFHNKNYFGNPVLFDHLVARIMYVDYNKLLLSETTLPVFSQKRDDVTKFIARFNSSDSSSVLFGSDGILSVDFNVDISGLMIYHGGDEVWINGFCRGLTFRFSTDESGGRRGSLLGGRKNCSVAVGE